MKLFCVLPPHRSMGRSGALSQIAFLQYFRVDLLHLIFCRTLFRVFRTIWEKKNIFKTLTRSAPLKQVHTDNVPTLFVEVNKSWQPHPVCWESISFNWRPNKLFTQWRFFVKVHKYQKNRTHADQNECFQPHKHCYPMMLNHAIFEKNSSYFKKDFKIWQKLPLIKL